VVRIVSRDRRGLFSLIAGTLALHSLDVVGADAFTAPDGTAVDEFMILRNEATVTNWVKLEHDLRAALDGEFDIDGRLEQRIRNHGRGRRPLAAAPARREVLISNDVSASTTVIDVRAPDGPAVLYRLSHALADAGVDIRSAKVATLGHEVVDVFYVQGTEGQIPVERHAQLGEMVKAALAVGAG